MVALFVRLKWTLTTGRLRAASRGARTGTAIGLAVGVLVSVGIGLSLAALRWQPAVAGDVLGAVFTVQFLAWVLAPLVAFGVDETLDPRRFALLPLTPGRLRAGLLASAVVGYLPLFNVIVLAGAAVGLSARWAMLPVAVLCCAAQLAMCIVFSRAASTSMVMLLASRRGRDVGVLVGIALMGGYFALILLLNRNEAGPDVDAVLAGIRPLGYGPPGALAQLAVAESSVRAAQAAITAGAFLAIGWWWWGRALRHTMTTVPSTTTGNAAARPGDLGHAVADTLWRTALVVATRDMRLAWRDPARRLQWAVVILFTAAWPFLYSGTGTLFAVVLGAAMVGAQTANHYGVEGSGLWLHLVTYGDRMRARGEATGHAVASFAPGAVIVAAGLALQVAVRGHADLLPAAVGVCLAALLGSIAGACLMSAVMPYAMPQSRTSVFASSVAGQKGRAAGASFALLGIAAATAVPAGAAALAAVTVDPVWGYAGIGAALLCGVPLLVVLIGIGARRYLARGPEILAVVSVGDRS